MAITANDTHLTGTVARILYVIRTPANTLSKFLVILFDEKIQVYSFVFVDKVIKDFADKLISCNNVTYVSKLQSVLIQ